MEDINRKSLDTIIVERSVSHFERGPDGITREVTRNFKQKAGVRSVDSSKRFAHYIIDGMVMSGVYFGPSIYFNFIGLPLIVDIIVSLSWIFLFPAYYIFCEHYFQQTIGKMVTGSVVINEYAEPPTLSTAILRTLIRAVPFEPYSCSSSPSRGWHDEWTHTWVVSKKEAERLKALVAKHNAELNGGV